MENRKNANQSMVAASPQIESGRWVPVDEQSLGFSLPPIPSKSPVVGPDGAIYQVGESVELAKVASNSNNAVPAPSSIVQMPAIVQPIALVPYTSQNQPMLQYDPYSRPVEPQGAPKSPVYYKKPYRGISAVAIILSLVGILLLLLLSVAVFQANDMREGFKLNGIGAIKSIADVFGVDTGSEYAKVIIGNADANKIIVSIFPFLVAIIAVIFLALLIKYLVKFASKKTPRGFSWLTLVNIILIVLAAVMLLLMSNAEVEQPLRAENTAKFFSIGTLKSTISWGWGLFSALIISIVMLFVPLFAKKNAYAIEKDDPSKKTYIIED